jgi:hypothetical protein
METKSYYECHITLEGDPSIIKPIVEDDLRWKFSAIDGDIVLGSGVKCYATKHYNTKIPEKDIMYLLFLAAEHLEFFKIKVLRRKIEKVIFDDRSSKVKPCDGGCIECHLDDLKG